MSESTVDNVQYKRLWVSFIRVRTLIEYRINCWENEKLTGLHNTDWIKDTRNKNKRRQNRIATEEKKTEHVVLIQWESENKIENSNNKEEKAS